MKNYVIILIGMLISMAAMGQNQSNPLEEVEVTPPNFTGIKNIETIEDQTNSIANYVAKHFVHFDSYKSRAEGIVVIQFKVTPIGKLANFKVINSISSRIDKEIIRVLKTTDGMWKPGFNNGTPVEMTKEVAVKFVAVGNYGEILNPNFLRIAQSYFSKGSKSLFIKEKPKKALRKYDMALLYAPYDKSAILIRGLCRYELGQLEGARQDWMRLKELGGIDMTMTLANKDIKKLKGFEEFTAMFIEREK